MPQTPASSFPQIAPLGIDGLLVRFADHFSDAANRATLAFRAEADALALPGLLETAGSLGAVYLRFDPILLPHARLTAEIERLLAARDWFDESLPLQRRLWHVPTAWGGAAGPQLDEVAAQAGCSAQAAVEQLSQARLRVMAIGFAPGLPYLGQLPERWNLPRQPHLQTRVPPGAIGLAIRQFVLFPTESPTGWFHVARTAFRCFRPDGSPAFPLRPGDEMIFPSVPEAEVDRLAADPTGGASCEALA